MTRSSRLSIGGGSVLGDASSRYNLRSSSVSRDRSRRISLGCLPSPSTESNESDKTDRRAMLEEWRKQVRNREKPPVLSSSTAITTGENKENNSASYVDSNKRARTADSIPRIPRAPSSNTSTVSDGKTALERFRMRRSQQQQLHQQLDSREDEKDISSSTSILPPHPTHSTLPSPCREDTTISFSSRITTPKLSISASSRTSSSRRRSLSLNAGPRRRNRSSISPADALGKS